MIPSQKGGCLIAVGGSQAATDSQLRFKPKLLDGQIPLPDVALVPVSSG